MTKSSTSRLSSLAVFFLVTGVLVIFLALQAPTLNAKTPNAVPPAVVSLVTKGIREGGCAVADDAFVSVIRNPRYKSRGMLATEARHIADLFEQCGKSNLAKSIHDRILQTS